MKQVMQGHRRLPDASSDLDAIRGHRRAEVERLPPALRRLERSEQDYAIERSAGITALRDRLTAERRVRVAAEKG